MTYETNKAEAVENFTGIVMPYIKANNSPENIKYILKFKLEKFYSDAFADGQENVLNDNNNLLERDKERENE